MLGPRGMAFDNDDALEENDDEDLKNDPVSTMDMQVRNTMFRFDCRGAEPFVMVGASAGLPQRVRGTEYAQLLCGGRAAQPGRDRGRA